MRHNVREKRTSSELGCLFLGLAGISVWVWIIVACVKVELCICGLIGAIVSTIIFRVFRKKSINLKTIIASIFGIVFSTITAIHFGMGVIFAILLSIGLNMLVISIYNIIYEAHK